MSEHGGPAGADGCVDGRGRETHGMPLATDARTMTTASGATDVGWRQRHEIGVLRGGAGGGMERTALTIAPPAAKGTPAPRPLESLAAQGEHLGKDVLWQVMTGGLSSAEMRPVFGHLLRGCASCREQAREVWNLPPATSASCAAVDATAAAAPPAGELETSDHADSADSTIAREPHSLPPIPPTLATPAIITAGPLDASSAEAAERSEAGPAAGPGGPNEMAYETVLDRVFSRIATEEAGIEVARRRADVLFEELMQHPPAR